MITRKRRFASAIHSPVGLALMLVLAPVGATRAANDVPAATPGDTTTEVIAKLGKPQGSMSRGRYTTFYYDRGLVHFVNGRVQTAFLVSPEEAERHKEERAKAEAAAREQNEAQRQRLTEEGRAALVQSESDKTLAAKSAAERLAYWQDFARRYPYTDVSGQIAKAQGNVESDVNQQRQSIEIQALKERIAAIQTRFIQLDADYAASLANWKRNEIDAERVKLKAEQDAALIRIVTLQGQSQGATSKAGER